MPRRREIAPLVLALALVACDDQATTRPEQGRELYEQGRYALAARHFRADLGRDPHDPTPHLWLGKSCARLAEFEQAADHLRRAIDLWPDCEEAHRELAAAYREQAARAEAGGDPRQRDRLRERAERAAAALLALQPSDSESYRFLATLARDRGRVDEALRHLGQALALCPDDLAARLESIELLLAEGRADEAEARCRELLGIDPGSVDARRALADIRCAAGDAKTAAVLYGEILETKKADLHARLGRATAHLALGKLDEALADADAALRVADRSARARFVRGAVYQRRGDHAAATHEFQLAVAQRRDHVPSYLALARSHLARERPREAAEALRTALKIEPKSIDARLLLAQAHLGQHFPDAAIKVLEEGRGLDPDHAAIHRWLGRAHCDKGDRKQALRHFREMARLLPQSALAHRLIGETLLDDGDALMAVHHGGEALTLEPESIDALVLIGRAHLAGNDPDKAKPRFLRALGIDSKHAVARMGLAEVYRRNGLAGPAESLLRRCIEDAPRLTGPYYALARLYTDEGEFAKARAELDRLRDIETDRTRVDAAIRDLQRRKARAPR